MNDDRLLTAAASALERGNALRALEHLDGIDTVSAEAWNLRAIALAQTGDASGAHDAVRRGLSLEPQHPALLYMHATMTENLESPDKAEEAYLSLLREHPNHVSGLLGYGWLLASNGDTEGARAVLERVSGHVGAGVPDALALAGVIACADGDLNTSRTLLDRGLQADPNSVRLHALRAMLASTGGEGRERTSRHLRAAAASNPRNAAALGYSARYLDHWALVPLRIFNRFSTAQIWLAWIATLFVLRRILPDGPLLIVVLVYVSLAVYSWVAPPVLRWWLRRKGEL